MGLTCGISTIIQTKRQVEGTQGITRQVANLRTEERAQGRVHGERFRISVSQIHTRCQHGDGQFAALFTAHSLQFSMQLHIFWGIECKFKTHIIQCAGNTDTTVEIDATPYSITTSNSCFRVFYSGDIQCGIHRFTSKLDI